MLAAGSSGEAGDDGNQLDDVHRLGDVCLKAGQERATPIFWPRQRRDGGRRR